ncbi:hypothetical protein BKA93DRAFT_822542 [Sparassis latifolia]
MPREEDTIFEEGFLVQPPGIDPETGERWKPRWVAKRDCDCDALSRWEANKAGLREFEVARPEVKKKEEEYDYLGEAVIPIAAFAAGSPWLAAKPEVKEVVAVSSTRPESMLDIDSFAVADPGPVRSRSPRPFVLDEGWLLSDGISSARGMYVQIGNSWADRSTPGFWRGRLEGARGAVLAVYRSHATARVSMLSPREPSETFLVIPLKYLWPVPPDEAGQRIMVMSEGGQLGRAWSKIRDG